MYGSSMAYAASVASSSVKDATVRDLVIAKKFIKLSKCNELVLPFSQIMTYKMHHWFVLAMLLLQIKMR